MESTQNRKQKPTRVKTLENMVKIAFMQLEKEQWRRQRARRLPHRARLLVRAQLLANAERLHRFYKLSRKQGTVAAVEQVGLGLAHEFTRYWAQFVPSLEEEVVDAAAEATKSREEEVGWIKQQGFGCIRILAVMAEFPVPWVVGDKKVVYEQYVGRLVEQADDFLEYLWDKVHSGTWICPALKEALDLDQILAPVFKFELPHSYFSPSMQDRAASVLRKWHDEDEEKTYDDPWDPAAPEPVDFGAQHVAGMKRKRSPSKDQDQGQQHQRCKKSKVDGDA
jgi:hypothetical protein